MTTRVDRKLLHVRALHLADFQPYLLENRWINTDAVPDALNQDFQTISSNEWLLENVPFTHGDISFFAVSAPTQSAQHLACARGDALLCFDRLTWDGDKAITKVCITYGPGHMLKSSL